MLFTYSNFGAKKRISWESHQLIDGPISGPNTIVCVKGLLWIWASPFVFFFLLKPFVFYFTLLLRNEFIKKIKNYIGIVVATCHYFICELYSL